MSQVANLRTQSCSADYQSATPQIDNLRYSGGTSQIVTQTGSLLRFLQNLCVITERWTTAAAKHRFFRRLERLDRRLRRFWPFARAPRRSRPICWRVAHRL